MIKVNSRKELENLGEIDFDYSYKIRIRSLGIFYLENENYPKYYKVDNSCSFPKYFEMNNEEVEEFYKSSIGHKKIELDKLVKDYEIFKTEKAEV